MAASRAWRASRSSGTRASRGTIPAGLSFSKSVEQMSTAERSLTYKATLLKTYDTAVVQAKEIYDLVCLGEVGRHGPGAQRGGPLHGRHGEGPQPPAGRLRSTYHLPGRLPEPPCREHVPGFPGRRHLRRASPGPGAGDGPGRPAGRRGHDHGPGEPSASRPASSPTRSSARSTSIPPTASRLLEKVQGVSDIVLSAAYQHHERLTGRGLSQAPLQRPDLPVGPHRRHRRHPVRHGAQALPSRRPVAVCRPGQGDQDGADELPGRRAW